MSDLDDVRVLKQRATVFRNIGQFDLAIEALDHSIDALNRQLDSAAHSATSLTTLREIRVELADTWGMKGGVYRRAGNPTAALESYQRGYELEQQDKAVTYNLSNLIALKLTALKCSPLDPDVRADIEAAIGLLKLQTAGPRRDEWWAWCDLAQFYLLHGEPDKAYATYIEGRRRTGPSSKEIKRHAEILLELSNAILTVAPDIAGTITAMVGSMATQAGSGS